MRLLSSVVCLILAAAVLAGSAPRSPSLRVLQLNLCGSGLAGCYTGHAVSEAAGVIRTVKPDVVTLNEICEADAHALATAMGGGARVAFQAVPDRPSGGPTRCVNGQAYGIGVLAHASRDHLTFSGVYPAQDIGDPEDRIWLCIFHLGTYYACTTHLTNTNPAVAQAQCRYLLTTAIPVMRANNRNRPVVLGGDLNLTDIGSCLPSGYFRVSSGGLQHVVSTSEIVSATSIDMRGTTDHPALLVTIAPNGG